MQIVQKIVEKMSVFFQENATKTYLVLANMLLVFFAIWFSNVGLIPFKNTGDFFFFTVLVLILALYRPGWTFVFFIGTLVLENTNIAPEKFGMVLRPYQFFGALTIGSLVVRMAANRLSFPLPKFRWFDILPLVFVVGGFLGALSAPDKGVSFEQALIAASFVSLYFLTRVYVQSLEDLKRVVPFLLSSSMIVSVYGIWQNINFISGGNSFEVMPGRPNATFMEADWFGIFLVFVLASILGIIYKKQKQKNKAPFFVAWICLVFVFIALILTVSRSAWLGAAVVIIIFLKLTLIGGSWEIFKWRWVVFLKQGVLFLVTIAVSIAIVYTFGLTRFRLLERAQSTGGLQKITVACENENAHLPDSIDNVAELEQYSCVHIDLEDIDKERAGGRRIAEIYRSDPNVNIRAGIYRKSIEQIKQHPVLGIGWGTIGSILGKDDRGAGLNASNIFLETWLGAGLGGLLAVAILLVYILTQGSIDFMSSKDSKKTASVFVILGWFAVVIPNLFNSGIFLGFIWVYLAAAVGLLNKKS